MRKRSKKRIPQDIKPWSRLREVDHDVMALPGKKTTRWVAGGRRDWNTRVLNTAKKHEFNKIIFRSFRTSVSNDVNNAKELVMQKINSKLNSANKTQSLGKYKNFCLISGRGRTYSRSLYLARHNMRKLVGVGIISGIIK